MGQFSPHSSEVELWIVIDGRRVTLSHLWHDGFIVREALNFPPTEAELVSVVDGRERRWSVYLPKGLSATAHETHYVLRNYERPI